ncbi:MAG TPA: PepSY-associated TM helix domain-containing protein [Reyranella sp.]|uniref:PepSY-associated TM helix domain-containing protein n=1 Tax=Reyranella sp. TaxID=1929291 RepID=UPI0026028C7D|nr:PepSY-associated TM helix domain-containing protein [Reyranella sp.]HQS13667.1 PepSY-associated TM helix domain-containing protein [Reyranella sp.]HQT10152.1 PepSY-associated TM helix domain-containing protein [Reyranella sp.]
MAKGLKPQRRTFRYWLQQIHLWIGLVLLLPLVMMGITGAVLVYAHDIEHLLGQGEPPVKTEGEWQSAGRLIEAAKAANTEPGRIPIAVRWPVEVGEPAAVRLSRPGMANERPQFRGGQPGAAGNAQPGQPAQGRVPTRSPFAASLQVLIDPVSLQVLETQQAMTGWVRFFHDLHGHIFIPGGVGREIVGWLGVAMLVLGCSGLYLWWPRPAQWKQAFMVRRKAKGLRLNRELHGAVGIWSLVIFMLVNFTGVYLAFPQQISAAVNLVSPGRDMRAAMFQARVEPMRGTPAMAVDEAVDLAKARVPGARSRHAFPECLPADPPRPGAARRSGAARPSGGRARRHGDRRSLSQDRGRRVRSADHVGRREGHRLAARAALRHRARGRLQVPGLRVGRHHPGLRRHRLPDVVDQAPQPPRRRTGEAGDPARRRPGRRIDRRPAGLTRTAAGP